MRVVEGLRGSVRMKTTMRPRFDYGKTRPWVQRDGRVVVAQAGPSALELRSDVPARRGLARRRRRRFGWTPASEWRSCSPRTSRGCRLPLPSTRSAAEAETETWWSEWAARSTYRGPWGAEVERSLVTLKALTYAPTGGIVAAATTSLPEFLGGVRNWDYRYCWLRDAALSLDALMAAGYVEEATSWRNWVLRAVAGDPEDLQIMYGIAGERRLEEFELPWLPGYEGSAPVRVGNAASGQLQLDVYGELVDAIYRARQLGMPTAPQAIDIGLEMAAWLGGQLAATRRRHLGDPRPASAVRALQGDGMGGHRSHGHDRSKRTGWTCPASTKLRDEIHDEICDKGFDAERNTFTQYYGSTQLDASLLLIPQVGFLPPDDPRVVGTIEAVQRELVHDGFVMRYIPDEDAADGLPPGEGAFLACSFWLVESLAMIGRVDEARELFDRLLSLRNELGLLLRRVRPAEQAADRQLPPGVHPPDLDLGRRRAACGQGLSTERTATSRYPSWVVLWCPLRAAGHVGRGRTAERTRERRAARPARWRRAPR